MTAASSCWQLQGAIAALTCGPLAARVDLSQVQLGLSGLVWQSEFISGQVLSFDVTGCKLMDSYVRGTDLVATFERSGSLAAAPQIYWRVREHLQFQAISIELILSMRTDLLDSRPQSHATSSLARAVMLQAGSRTTPTICRLPGSLGTYAELIHPDDYDAREVTPGTGDLGCQMQSRLFPERLEKGVIRRARVCGWFLPRENDVEVAATLARQFIDEPLPLTT